MFTLNEFNITGDFSGFFREAAENFPAIIAGVAVLIIITIITNIILRVIEHYLIAKMKKRAKSPGEYEKRVNTLSGVFNKFICIFIWAIGMLVVVARLGMDISPFVALAGIVGVAVGFGAQGLVKDIINGVLILIENQIRVGDVASINSTRGLVTAINWRTITLRNLSGAVHVFSNSSINELSNLTKEWSAHVFDIRVAYKENTDNVVSAIRDVAGGLEKDEVYGEKIIEPVEIFGLDKVADSAIVIKGRIKTRPFMHRAIGREFNRRIKIEFDRRGIAIPFPHQRIYMGPPSGPLEVEMKNKE